MTDPRPRRLHGVDVRTLGDDPLRIEDLVRLARGEATPVLAPGARDRMKRSAEIVAVRHGEGDAIYGVTTSVGGSVGTAIPPARAAALSLNVLRMHGVGAGRMLDDEETAAVIVARLSSLACGRSGVRPEVAERLVELLVARVLPQMPCEGSVGASGDLTPLSYLAAVLVGEREVRFEGVVRPAAEVLAAQGLAPLALGPKEALGLMNGTSVSTALACLGWSRAERLARTTTLLSAMVAAAIGGNPEHFDDRIHAAKPHPGQREVARRMRAALDALPDRLAPMRLQDRYSVRCAPHVIGVLVDALRPAREALETELGGVSDNPIVDLEAETILHGGNFYGGHVAFACDALKIAVANVACLVDRQLMLLCHPAENGGLPTDLVGVSGSEACAHNGFKAASIAASSMAAEAQKQAIPASLFSRSTELHNQDKVPMATTAARDLLRVVELAEQVAAIALLAACQAFDLRGFAPAGPIGALRAGVREVAPRLVEDRRMDLDLQALLQRMRSGALDGEGSLA
ncbi:MAG: aromatic amino acid ammonia-lyase [Myxococcota bacterium]